MRLSSAVWAPAGVTKTMAATPIQALNPFVRNVVPPLAQFRRPVRRGPQAGKTLKMR
jgi:hypothetical protein